MASPGSVTPGVQLPLGTERDPHYGKLTVGIRLHALPGPEKKISFVAVLLCTSCVGKLLQVSF